MNNLTLAGHIGNDPEVRYTSSGTKVTTFRLATNSRRSGKEETTWWRITVWGEQFDKLMPHLKKGSAVIILGELTQAEIYNNREGQPQVSLNVTAHNIQFSPFGGKRDQQQNSGGGYNQAPQQSGGNYYEQPVAKAAAPSGHGHLSDDEIPF